MAKCVCCRKNRKLTREHVIPHGLLRLLESKILRPGIVWSRKTDRVYKTKNPVVKDLCVSCQHRLHKIFDSRVSLLFSYIMKGLEHQKKIFRKGKLISPIPPLEIEVEEPFFTFYFIRVIWNHLRMFEELTHYEDAFSPLRDHVVTGKELLIPKNIFIGMTYHPPVKYPGCSIGFNFSYADARPRIIDGRVQVTRASLHLFAYRLLIGEVAPEHASKTCVRNFFHNSIKKQNGILLWPNLGGLQKYIYRAIDPVIFEELGSPTDKITERVGEYISNSTKTN